MTAILLLGLSGLCAGCKPYRIERHKRSPIFFNEKYVVGGVQREVQLDDGTLLVFEPVDTQASLGRGDDENEPFKIREEMDDGTVVLRALLPEHVLLNLLACLRAEEYELIYKQLLSQQTRDAYEMEGGYESFAAYMRRNRVELAKLVTRMIAGLAHQEVTFTPMGNGITRCRLRPQVGGQFRFRSIDVYRDQMGQYTLQMIR